jgi:SAM-dependent methyltransferase
MTSTQNRQFFQEYTSEEAILKYTKAAAGSGISYLLDNDYKRIYLKALELLPQELRQRGIRMLEFGCGGGMNLIHLVAVLKREGIKVEEAIGTDFSPVLIEAAKRESKNYLPREEISRLQFHVGKNETLISDLSSSLGVGKPELQNTFHFIFGVNTIRYCFAAKEETHCAQDIFDLLVPGGVCVSIDMNNRFPLFRSDLKSRLRRTKEEECYVPSLEEYVAPFRQTGFEVIRSEHFCWVPHSAGKFLCSVTRLLSPLLDMVVPSRAMRALVVARKPS